MPDVYQRLRQICRDIGAPSMRAFNFFTVAPRRTSSRGAATIVDFFSRKREELKIAASLGLGTFYTEVGAEQCFDLAQRSVTGTPPIRGHSLDLSNGASIISRSPEIPADRFRLSPLRPLAPS